MTVASTNILGSGILFWNEMGILKAEYFYVEKQLPKCLL